MEHIKRFLVGIGATISGFGLFTLAGYISSLLATENSKALLTFAEIDGVVGIFFLQGFVVFLMGVILLTLLAGSIAGIYFLGETILGDK